MLLPDMEASMAAGFAEHVRKTVQDLTIPHAANEAHGTVVTVSIGCCTAIPGSHPLEHNAVAGMRAILSSCDRALYEAKNAGRNLVVVESEPRMQEVISTPTLPVLS